MDENIAQRSSLKTTDDYEAAMKQLFIAMDFLSEQMDRDRTDIDQIQRDTQIIKAETEIIKSRIQVRLDELEAAV